MKRTYVKQRTPNSKSNVNKSTIGLLSNEGVQVDIALQGFLDSRRGMSPGTTRFYREKLTPFVNWLRDQMSVNTLEEITPNMVRDFLGLKEEQGSSSGGQHAFFRAIRAMLSWHEQETDFEYQSPIRRVKAPKVEIKPLPGVEVIEIQRLVAACAGPNKLRDQAIFEVLFDTGARASEFLSLNIEDVNFANGAVTIKHGKGDKERTVFLGVKSRKGLRMYLKSREDIKGFDPLFVSDEDIRLSYSALKEVIRRRAVDAELDGQPYPHDFRRAFAITLWRNGVDIVTIARLMGHSTLEVLKRYLNQNTDDLARAHAKASPVDTKL